MRDDPDLDEYMNSLTNFPVLSEAEEIRLVKKMQRGDTAARERLILSNLRLVVSIAKRYQTDQLSFLELIYEGNYGLVQAVDRYLLGKNTRFASYATYWINQSIILALKVRSRRIHVSADMFAIVASWRKARRRLEQKLMRPPTIEEIAEEIKLPPKKINSTLHALDAMRNTANDEMIAAELTTSGDQNNPQKMSNIMFGDESDGGRLSESDDRKLEILLNCFPERSRTVLRMRMGMHGQPRRTLEEIAQTSLGISLTRERARQLETETLKKILYILDR